MPKLLNKPVEAGWRWFDELQTPAPDDAAQNFAKCFASVAGARVLDYLSQMIVERVMPPSADTAEVFYHEGQRATVALIKSMIARGKTQPNETN